MKRISALLIPLLLLGTLAFGQTFYSWRYLESADCDAETSGRSRDLCHDTGNDFLYKCEPSAGYCDTAGEWKQITIPDGVADGSTKGKVAFTAADFDASSGVVSIDYTNGQAAATAAKGFLTATDWNTFNDKQGALVDSSGLATAVDDETGTGVVVFGTSPSLTTPAIAGMTGTGVLEAGGATSLEIPNATDPDVTVEGQISWDSDDDTLRGFDGTNQVVVGQKLKQFTVTITKPLDLDEADTLPVWKNRTGFTFNIEAIYSDSDTDDTAYTLKEAPYNDYSSLTTIEAITISTDGTNVYYNDLTSGIDHTTIESGNVILFDNDAADDPAYISFVIVGYYDANVD